jgi:hypothetical protein
MNPPSGTPLAQIVDIFTTVSRVTSVFQLLVLFRLVFGNLHLSLICYNNFSILLPMSILLVGRVQ